MSRLNMSTLVMSQELPRNAQLVMLAITSHYRPKKGEMRPSSKRIAKLSKLCQRSVFRWLNWLETNGYLIRQYRCGDDNSNLANLYTLGRRFKAFLSTVSRATDNKCHTRNGKSEYNNKHHQNRSSGTQISNSEIAKQARPGESWEQARTRLLRTRH